MNQNRIKLVSIFIGAVLVIVSICFLKSANTYAFGHKEYTDAQKKFFKNVYEHMTNRDIQFEVNYTDKDMEWSIDDIYYVLAQIDSTSTVDDYDYLRGNVSQIDCVTEYSVAKGAVASFTIEWLEDRDQTKDVEQKIDKILKIYDVKNMSQYDKIRFVHDYIATNVEYDDDKKYFSAFDGLFRGKTVCQGYALLTYRMLTQAGVRCRYIVGKYIPKGSSEGENHAWNLVKLGDKWYYLDTTWDSCNYREAKVQNSLDMYFLKGSKSFEEEHVADEIENGDDFNDKYEISTVDFYKSVRNTALIDDGDDIAVTPHEFFRYSGDGTVTSSKILAFFDKIYVILSTRFVEIFGGIIIIIILVVTINKQRQ